MDWLEMLKELLDRFGDHFMQEFAKELLRNAFPTRSDKSEKKKKSNSKHKNRKKQK